MCDFTPPPHAAQRCCFNRGGGALSTHKQPIDKTKLPGNQPVELNGRYDISTTSLCPKAELHGAINPKRQTSEMAT
jgi:hypothetical protein